MATEEGSAHCAWETGGETYSKHVLGGRSRGIPRRDVFLVLFGAGAWSVARRDTKYGALELAKDTRFAYAAAGGVKDVGGGGASVRNAISAKATTTDCYTYEIMVDAVAEVGEGSNGRRGKETRGGGE